MKPAPLFPGMRPVLYNTAPKDIIEQSVGIYDGAEAVFPFLKMKDSNLSLFLFSRLMSVLIIRVFIFLYGRGQH
jgi:hypothetical protein